MPEVPRRAPRPAGDHPRWRSTLASTFYGFRVLWDSDHSPGFLFVFFLFRPGGCKIWAGSRSRLPVLIEIEPGMEAFEP